jgi:hypothetical protein
MCWPFSCLIRLAYSGHLVTPRDRPASRMVCRFLVFGERVFRQRAEMDFRKIGNAFRESDRFGLSKSLFQAFRRVTGGSRADRP